ncbi:hypothetical protein CIL05_12775 [Virgibacillus profundi]|uniref:HTH cro/C1-type domain-containing protein n=1 Tax=Virgibacillus profundi TaxID=2024555 RepID=A0A2A2IDV7_9BACI|nr:helix-turn-helix transcriptional regulator [Virgibacillus profundi]PAV29263.1 hypothetical protein CIL05_12775 [Virgibacillus profundi]PXY53432.1 XRE family transcriptional regulator [Virgibacillus profundi]
MSDLGIEIKRTRKSKRITQKQLAERLNVAESTVRMWELGKNKPSVETIAQIANILEVDFLYLAYLAGINLIKTETDKEISDLLKSKENLLAAYKDFELNKDYFDLHELLSIDNHLHYKDKLLTKEEKEKLLTIIETVLG